ncbi:uncharacterized protein NECHADRAFT_86780 [Fusarium vanettenii 77-13-4]|uniref:Lysine-specific metallo-endopeptidase domain-containing protein n=1 Tax=Fusarium vanettenii (strain ATCC MYA-4622 / CBS 123669 / FGSC 9596 / NRRL 45880 / 77-13-4) TaxID=660122 RepID=C7ZK19_FUSV7|nr:uncharacterized protein NECHADRAFT_86780 [Fusarium vanettenii 77-13-4]EEU35601.1 hypothetical protein NECHADRAFT_86780 [Fusarium vanettenii 77-13-4]
MRTVQLAWLLVGFLAALGRAQNQDFKIGGWTFDQTCEPYKAEVTKAIEDALAMAEKAQTDLNDALGEFEMKKNNDKHKNQVRIARAMGRCFGFMAKTTAESKSDQYWESVFYTFDRMVPGLQGPDVNVKFGYYNPLIICKDNVWVWLGPEDKDPTAPDMSDPNDDEAAKEQKEEANKMKKRHAKKFEEDGYAGAWYYKQRIAWRKTKENLPPSATCAGGGAAVTHHRLDLIHICESNFVEAKIKDAPSPVGATTTRGTTKITSFNPNLAVTLVHEFAHWYGSENTGPDTKFVRELIDQQAISSENELCYKKTLDRDRVYSKRKISKDERKEQGLVEDVVYGFKDVSNLAKTWDKKPGSKYGGPEKATMTAEAFSYFALMA